MKSKRQESPNEAAGKDRTDVLSNVMR